METSNKQRLPMSILSPIMPPAAFIGVAALLLLSGATASAQTSGKPIAQVPQTAGKATPSTTPAQYLQNSRQAQDNNNYAEAKAYAQKAVEGFTALDQPDSLGEAFVMLWSASALSNMPFADRIPLLEKAAAAFEKAGNRKRKADCLKEMADLQQLTGNYSAAFVTLQNALQLYQSVNYPRLQGVYDLLCSISGYFAEYDEGVRYGLLAIRSAENTQDTSLSLCTFYNHLGTAYYGMRDYEKGLQYYMKSLDVARKYNSEDGIVTLSFNTVILLTAWGRPRQALDFFTGILNRYPGFFAPYTIDVDRNLLAVTDRLDLPGKSSAYAAAVEKALARKDLDFDRQAQGYFNLVFHYLKRHQYAKADYWLLQYNDFIQPMKNATYTRQNQLLHFMVDSAEGKLISAIRHYQQFKRMSDTVFSQARSRHVEQYTALYETEKKNRNILLLQQQSQAQQTQLRQEQFLSRVTLGGIVLLIIIIGLLYYTVRVKQRSNRLLKVQRAEIDRKNHSLQRLVTEKDWLVKEIHHRVKNNLHMVVGLLASQAEYLKGEEAYDAITESQHRIQAMSLIHQKLYNTENLSSIDMPHYVHELVDYLESSFDTVKSIRFVLDIAKVSFPLAHSIPIGLILNEAITNAIKYAFPDGRKGQITIQLQHSLPGASYRLIIRDDGIGIPEDRRRKSSLGLSLIEGLSRDIRGQLGIINDNGTVISLTFPVAPATITS
ncbi:MAG TPA: histidine kinase dimerization/phosphoacceptor domain -containing protein [Puia sp.]|uniref:histidine kinase dimerization/phosphoacceptor domain -containing protein n=1 Tax=Puia sp. TaxID=2045100 RepID=UPI002C9B6458|nr:histidine kinase dimerization/phosphoacceptor domain -containing protein [Puia sp.]HVU95257.1 histidine kinase dimerization/phosphoacceptor domain -containing protein [Puia sp.]